METDNIDIHSGKEPRLLFHKSERLRHKSLIDPLFEKGGKTLVFPLRVFWRIMTEEDLKSSFRCEVPDRMGPLQVMFTVPKRKLRHAVDRVSTRRRIREAYRLLRLPLKEAIAANPAVRTMQVAFIYTADTPGDMTKLTKKMSRIVALLVEEVNKFQRNSDEKSYL